MTTDIIIKPTIIEKSIWNSFQTFIVIVWKMILVNLKSAQRIHMSEHDKSFATGAANILFLQYNIDWGTEE